MPSRSITKWAHTPGRSCSSTSGALAAKVLKAEEKVPDAVKCWTITFGSRSAAVSSAVVAARVGAHLRAAGGAERDLPPHDARARRRRRRRRGPARAGVEHRVGVPPRRRARERAGRQFDHERAGAAIGVVLPARGGAAVVREDARGQADGAGVAAHDPLVGARGEVHEPQVLVVPDGDGGPDPPHQPAHGLGLRLGERARAGEERVERAAATAPAAGEVAVEIDPARVVARAVPDAVGVDGVDQPQLHAGGRRRAPQAPHHGPARRLVAVDRAHHQHLHRALPHARRGQRAVLGGVAEQERGRGEQGVHPRHGSVRVRMDSVVIVGAGTFGASLAWWLAREGVQRHARRPVRAGRPQGDLRRGDAADPLRPRRRPRVHRVGAPRPHALARARGGVGRGPPDRVRAGVVRPPPRRLGGGVRGDDARAGHPGRAAERRGGRAPVPELPRRRPRVPAPRARGRRAARPARHPGARRAGRGARRADRARGARGPRATRSRSTASASRPTPSCGRAAAGSRSCSRPTST